MKKMHNSATDIRHSLIHFEQDTDPDNFYQNAPENLQWLLEGYILAVDTIAIGSLAMDLGKEYGMSDSEVRAEVLNQWGVTEADILWASKREEAKDELARIDIACDCEKCKEFYND